MSDWYPFARIEQLVMIRNWIDVMDAETRAAWGIPEGKFTELCTRFASSQALLQKVMSEEDRTPVVTEQCRGAFGAQEETARFFHRHYFLVPPLTLADLVRLGLKTPNPPSPISRPENQPEADLAFPGIHQVELRKIRPVGGKPLDPRSDYRTRIYYGLTGAPTDLYPIRVVEPPKRGIDLPRSIFTRRKRERFDFEGESGNRVYFCLCYENEKGGEDGQGPFGPIISAVIP
jgi:hypothetical protein